MRQYIRMSAANFEWISIGAGLAAAVFWLISANVKVPNMEDTTLGGEGSITSIMKRQARWSAWGAIAAAISMIALALATYLNT